MSQATDSVRLAIVGNWASGKTSLQHALAGKPSPLLHEPTYDDESLSHNVKNNGQDVNLDLLVVAPSSGGRGDWGQNRYIAYAKSHAIVLCMNVTGGSNELSGVEYWKAEMDRTFEKSNYNELRGSSDLAAERPTPPVFLVGTKADLRDDAMFKDKQDEIITRAQAEEAAGKINAIYIETSAVTKEGIVSVLEKAVSAGVEYKRKYAQASNPSTKSKKLSKAAPAVVADSLNDSAVSFTAKKPQKKDCIIL
jgi:GTPase SAR1 family protein